MNSNLNFNATDNNYNLLKYMLCNLSRKFIINTFTTYIVYVYTYMKNED